MHNLYKRNPQRDKGPCICARQANSLTAHPIQLPRKQFTHLIKSLYSLTHQTHDQLGIASCGLAGISLILRRRRHLVATTAITNYTNLHHFNSTAILSSRINF